jgi:hypothetical protein
MTTTIQTTDNTLADYSDADAEALTRAVADSLAVPAADVVKLRPGDGRAPADRRHRRQPQLNTASGQTATRRSDLVAIPAGIGETSL